MLKALAIDLFCGLGGWTEGLLAEGYYVIGFDIERHEYGDHRYPEQLVVQDVLTLHGSQFKDAALIVASPPCQEYSYMAMPWKRAKAKAAAIRADTTGKELERLNRLFNACLRIQLEASVAAGRHVPMVIENVRGAQPWVGRARWSFGSFYLWGDVPALMPVTVGRQSMKVGVTHRIDGATNFHGQKVPGLGFNTHADHNLREAGLKSAGPRWDPGTKSGAHGMKRWTNPGEGMRIKCGGDWFGDNNPSAMRHARKFASAMIAKIPLPLSRHIAASFKPSRSTRQTQNAVLCV